MPILWEWFDEDQGIILIHFNQQWTLDNYKVVEAEILGAVSSQTGRFDIIVDFSKSTHTFPVGSLYEWLSGAEVRDADFLNWGLSVWIGISSVMRAYLVAGNEHSDAVQKHVRTAKTIQEAVQLIMNDRNKTDDD